MKFYLNGKKISRKEAQERAGLHSGHAEEIIETILP